MYAFQGKRVAAVLPSPSNSSDIKVLSATIQVRMGRKWRAQEAVDQTEVRLRNSVLVGAVALGWAGLGSNTTRPGKRKNVRWSRKKSKQGLRKPAPAGWLGCNSKRRGLDGSRQSTGCSNGQSCGKLRIKFQIQLV